MKILLNNETIDVLDTLIANELLSLSTTQRFKVKGELHAGVSKVKTLKQVDDAKLQLVNEIANQVTPGWRLAQFYTALQKEPNEILERSKIGEYIKLVIADVVKEDLDIITDAGLEIKDVSGKISGIARDYFFEQETLAI
jgi:hypothetical protein